MPWTDFLLHVLWPQTCAHCREDLAWNWKEPLCPSCLLELTPLERPWCERCGEPGAESPCPRCENRPHACAAIRSAFIYEGPAASLVHSFKYRGRRQGASAAGRWLAPVLERLPELGHPDALVPVPMHPRRLDERGYDQALLLATALSAGSGIVVWEALSRTRHTRPQERLDAAERRRNVSGAIALRAGQPSPTGCRLLLIDDVCTSGASLEACAKVLIDMGAAAVQALTLARQTLKV